MSAKEGFKIFCIGAAPGIAQLAADMLKAKYPGSVVVGTQHGFFSKEEEPAIVDAIAASGADILLVAMGIPRQEEFVLRNMDRLPAKVAMGVGGSFDVFSGRVKRAPVWWRRFRLEWLWRLIQDPSKFRRVSMLPKFVQEVRRQARNEDLYENR